MRIILKDDRNLFGCSCSVDAPASSGAMVIGILDGVSSVSGYRIDL